MTEPTPKRLRLLRVVVQPEYVLDNGTTLEPVPTNPAVIPAAAWPSWAVDRFPDVEAQMAADLDAES